MSKSPGSIEIKTDLLHKNEILSVCILLSEKFIEELEKVYKETNVYSVVINYLKQMKEHHTNADRLINSEESLGKYVSILKLYEDLDSVMKRLYTIMNNEYYITLLVRSKSHTFTSNAIEIKEKNNSKYALYLSENKKITKLYVYVEKLTHVRTMSVHDLTKFQDKLVDIPHGLMVHLSKIMLKRLPKNNSEHLRSFIKDLTDDALGLSVRSLTVLEPPLPKSIQISTDLSNIQLSCNRHNLSKVTDSMSYEDIIVFINKKLKTKFSSTDTISENHQIIVINNMIGSSIEFNLTNLVDIETITKEKLMSGEFSGLTPRYLARFNTIHDFSNNDTKRPKSTKDPKSNINKVSLMKSHKYIIVERTANDKYRIIAKQGEIITPIEIVRSLLSLDLSVEQYNNILADEIFRHCFDKELVEIVDRYRDAKTRLPPKEELKNHIKTNASKVFLDNVDISKIKKSKDFREFALSNNITKLVEISLNDTLFKHVHMLTSLQESIYTSLVKLDDITRSFMRAYSKAVEARKSQISEGAIRGKQDDQIRTLIIETFNDIINDAVNKLDKGKVQWDYLDFSLKEHVMKEKHYIDKF